MLGRHIEFIKERQYVMNVSPATIRWYTSALKRLDNEEPTQEELTRLVVKMRERGLKATGCNAASRAINAYLHWVSGAIGKCGGGCRHPHIKPMKEPELVPSVFAYDQVKKLLNFRARKFFERRLHLLILILLDTPYSPGTKTNVIFFTKGYKTESVWVYDGRSNVPHITKKDRPLTAEQFAEFEKCYGKDPNGRARRSPDSSKDDRWRSFSIGEVKERDYKIDSLKWIKDDSLDGGDDSLEPEEPSYGRYFRT